MLCGPYHPLISHRWILSVGVVEKQPKTVEELKRAIGTVVDQIPADTCRICVAEGAKRRAERCISKNECHVEIV